MRILLVSNYYAEHVGGIETVAANLAAGYRRAGHEVRWAAAETVPHDGSDDLPLRAWNVTERRLGFPYPIPGPRSARRLADAARVVDAVHVHDCLYASSVVAFAAARSARRPVLLTQHVAEVPYSSPLLRALQSSAYGLLGRRLLTGADQVVFVSERVRRRFAHLAFRRLPGVIENGVDTALFRPPGAAERRRLRAVLDLKPDQPLLLFTGRFVEKKGLALLRAAAAAEPGWRWLFVGRAGDYDPAAWGYPNVRVLPPLRQPELRDLYAAADLLVLPSRGEGFPVAVQEAMACGTPALVSSETAAALDGRGRELVIETETTEAAVMAKVRETIPARARALRPKVAAYAGERWGLDGTVRAYLELLTALVD